MTHRVRTTVFAVVLVLAMVLVTAGCGNVDTTTSADVSEQASVEAPAETSADTGEEADTGTGEKFDFVLVSPKVDDPYWLIVKNGFQAAADDYGFNAIYTGGTGHTVDSTVAVLDSNVASMPEGIAICPVSPPAFSNSLQRARDLGIKVVTVVVDANSPEDRDAAITSDFYQGGIEKMELCQSLMSEQNKNNMQVGCVVTQMDFPVMVTEWTAYQDWLAETNSGQLIDWIQDNADPSLAYTLTKDFFTAHPETNCIASTESGGSPGVGKALKELGFRDPNDPDNYVVFFACGATEEALKIVADGDADGTQTQDAWGEGYLCGQYLYYLTTGQDDKVEEITKLPLTNITADNLDNWGAELEAKHAEWREAAWEEMGTRPAEPITDVLPGEG